MPSEIKGEIRAPHLGSKTMTAVMRTSRLQEHPSSKIIPALRASRLQENLGSESILALSWTQEAEGSGQTRVSEQDACTSCCITEIMILVHHGKRQESEFPLGQCCGQEGFGAVLQDIGPPCLLLLGPLVCWARALKKPAEQTSLLCSCSAPRLFPCSGNAYDQDPVLSTTSRRVRRSKKKICNVTHCHKDMFVQQSRGSPGLCRTREFA